MLLDTGTIGGGADLGWGDSESDFYTTNKTETAAALELLTQTFPRIWMLRIYDTVSDPEGFIRGYRCEVGRRNRRRVLENHWTWCSGGMWMPPPDPTTDLMLSHSSFGERPRAPKHTWPHNKMNGRWEAFCSARAGHPSKPSGILCDCHCPPIYLPVITGSRLRCTTRPRCSQSPAEMVRVIPSRWDQ